MNNRYEMLVQCLNDAVLAGPGITDRKLRQADRGQRVVSTGPYAVARHPAYAGGLALGSLVAIIPVVLIWLPILIYRTTIKDKMLHNELAGYADYLAKVRYRLIPGIW